jgi:phosphoribosyl 1,2-cyclic phosphodiesterase
MILKVLGSESAGNCYLIESDIECLIIEAGIRLQEVKKALNYDLGKVIGCLISHSHGDHCRYARDYLKAGINIYTSDHTAITKEMIGHRIHIIKHYEVVTIGDFKVIPFPVPHGVPTLGFLIKHPASGSILFVTDAAFIPHKFSNLSHILIEANYEDAILTNDRAVGNHMSLDTCLEFLRVTDIKQIRNIVLLHLSSENSDSNMFAKSVKSVAQNAFIWIADKDLEINLSKYPF